MQRMIEQNEKAILEISNPSILSRNHFQRQPS